MAGTITHKETVIPPPGQLIDGVDWLAEHILNAPEIGAVLVGDPSQSDGGSWVSTGIAGQVLLSGGPGALPFFQTIVLSGHAILSATHNDAELAAVAAGDLLYGNGTPKWDRLPAGGGDSVLSMVGGFPTWIHDLLLDSLILGALTPGRIVFVDGANALADSGSFLWDDTGKNLRLGGASPGTNLGTGMVWGSGVAPTAAHPADAIQAWVADNIAAAGGTAGLWIRHEAGGRFYFGDSGFGESQIRIFESTLAKSVKLVVSTGGAIFGSDEDIPFTFGTNGTERLIMLPNGNIMIGVDSAVGTNAQGVLYLNSGVAPTTSPPDKGAIWVEDISGAGTAGFKFRVEDGYVHRIGRLLEVPVGDSASLAALGGVLDEVFADVATGANTTEIDAYSVNVLGGSLSVNGQSLYLDGVITFANNANDKIIRFKLGATTLITQTLTDTTGAASCMTFRLKIVRTGAATQRIFFAGDNVTLVGFNSAMYATAAETLANALTLKITIQNVTAAANDIVFRFAHLRWMPE